MFILLEKMKLRNVIDYLDALYHFFYLLRAYFTILFLVALGESYECNTSFFY